MIVVDDCCSQWSSSITRDGIEIRTVVQQDKSAPNTLGTSHRMQRCEYLWVGSVRLSFKLEE